METTLRAFYWRAIPLLLFFIAVMFLLALTMVGVAFAQDAGAVPVPEDPTTSIEWWLSTFRSGGATVIAILGAVVSLLHLPSWATALVDLLKGIAANSWEKDLNTMLSKGADYAVGVTGLTPDKIKTLKERNDFKFRIAEFLAAHAREYVQYYDQNKDGIPDFLQGRDTGPAKGLSGIIDAHMAKLAGGGLPQQDPPPAAWLAAERDERPAPKARVSDEALSRLAQKIGPRLPKGATKQ